MTRYKKLKIQQENLLVAAEMLFKLAFTTSSFNPPKLQYFDKFWWGDHVVTKRDLKLTKKQEGQAFFLFERVAVYTLATQIDTYLQTLFKDRFKHKNKDIKNTAWIIRLIRNSFAHSPFYPKWQLYSECENCSFKVKKIIKLNTHGLNGKPVNYNDYGGPLAILRLSRFIRNF